MDPFYPWLGDLNEIGALPREVLGLICILVSVLCGAVIGLERERREKPAGLRTLILISVGSTIFTVVSLLLSQQKVMADPARLAAQIIPGIGFLGAGAIIQARGTVRGLTTGATIWAVAAVGVTIGTGHIAAGIVFTTIILATLTLFHRAERALAGACEMRPAKVVYRPERGKTFHRLRAILDRYRIEDRAISHGDDGGEAHWLRAPVCTVHREHRGVLCDLAEIGQVESIELGERE